MEAPRNPEYLRSLMQAVMKFHDALAKHLELHLVNVEVTRGIAPAVLPREDADSDEIARRQALVARAAERASGAVPLTGIAMAVQGAGEIDPITNWQTITRPKPLEAADMLAACDHAIGCLDRSCGGEGVTLQVKARNRAQRHRRDGTLAGDLLRPRAAAQQAPAALAR